jgi:hypothetical protein
MLATTLENCSARSMMKASSGSFEFQPGDRDDVQINGSRFNGDNMLDSSNSQNSDLE